MAAVPRGKTHYYGAGGKTLCGRTLAATDCTKELCFICNTARKQQMKHAARAADAAADPRDSTVLEGRSTVHRVRSEKGAWVLLCNQNKVVGDDALKTRAEALRTHVGSDLCKKCASSKYK
jgi:hypothetical protein